MVRDLEVAFGESEFFMGLVAESLRRLGRYERPFTARISCGIVLDGLKDFFDTSRQLRRWNARLATRCGDFALDREMASALAADAQRLHIRHLPAIRVRDDLSLTIGVDIRCEGLVRRREDTGQRPRLSLRFGDRPR